MKWEFTVQVVTYKEQLWDNEYNHVYKHTKTDSFIVCTNNEVGKSYCTCDSYQSQQKIARMSLNSTHRDG